MSAQTWLIIAIAGFSAAFVALVVAAIIFFKLDIISVIGDLTGKTVAREIKAIREFNEQRGDRRYRPGRVNIERGTLTAKASSRAAQDAAHPSKRLDFAAYEEGTGQMPGDGAQPGSFSDVSRLADASYSERERAYDAADATAVLSDVERTVEIGSEAGIYRQEEYERDSGSEPTDILRANTADLSDNTEVLSEKTEVLSEETEILSERTEVLSRDTAIEEGGPPGTEALRGETDVLENTAAQPFRDLKRGSFKVVRSEILIHTDVDIIKTVKDGE